MSSSTDVVVGHRTNGTLADQAEAGAAVLRKRWGTALSLKREEWEGVAALALASGMNPAFDIDVLGERLYDNARYWERKIAENENVESIVPTRLRPGTDEWDEWLGDTPGEAVAAAVLTTIEMSNRSVPVQEANYVLMDDPMLTEWSQPEWFDKRGYRDDNERERAANDRADELREAGKSVNVFRTREGNYGVKVKIQPADFYAQALKKARTTSLRRAARVAVPGLEVQITATLDRMQQIVEQAQQRAGGVTATSDEPYAHDDTLDAMYGEDPLSRVIGERDRIRLNEEAARKGLPKRLLKAFVSVALDPNQKIREELVGLQGRELLEFLDGVTPRDVKSQEMTYSELAIVMEALDRLDEA